MKKYLFILLFAIGASCHEANSQTTDPTLDQLMAINEAAYINKPLDSIIAHLPAGYMTMKIRGIRGTARFLTVKYPNKVWIELHVRQFTHMNHRDPSAWNIPEMKMENLYSIKIHKGSECFKGCPEY